MRRNITRLFLAAFAALSVFAGCRKDGPEEPVVLKLDRTTLKLTVGQSQMLTAVLTGAQDELVWASDKEAVATVDGDGKVTAVGAGTAFITVKAAGKTAECRVEVSDFIADEMKLNSELAYDEVGKAYNIMLCRGEEFQFEPRFYKDEERCDDMVFPVYALSLQEPSLQGSVVAEIDDAGLLKATAAGTALLRVTGGGLTAIVSVTVKDVVVEPAALSLFVNGVETLTATVLPESLSSEDKSVVWVSSNEEYVTVDENGQVTALKNTSALEEPVVVKAYSGDAVAESVITVTDYEIDEIVLSTLDDLKDPESEEYTMLVGDLAFDLQPSYLKDGEDVTETVGELSIPLVCSSSVEDVATVSNGVITAKGPGKTLITISCAGEETSFELVVIQCVGSVEITYPETNPYTALEGSEFTIAYKVLPENASEKGVIFSSDKPEVVSVSATGEVRVGQTDADTDVTITVTTVGLMRPESGSQERKPATTVLRLKVSDELVPAKSITIRNGNEDVPAEMTLCLGDQPLALSYNVTTDTDKYGSKPCNDLIRWESLNNQCASVSEDGVVTLNAKGTAKIKVSAMSGNTVNASDEFTLNVIVPVTSVKSVEKLEFEIGDDAKSLEATAEPADASDVSLTYSTTSTGVISVSQDGLVALNPSNRKSAEATVTITAAGVRPGAESIVKTVPVIVKEVFATSVELNATSKTLDSGASFELSVNSIKPANVTDKTVSWHVKSGSEYITLSASEGNMITVTAKEDDNDCQAVVYAQCGQTKSADCTITIKKALVPVTSVTIDGKETQDLELKIGEASKKFVAVVAPGDATDKTITWASSNSEVASVSDGVITGISAGENVKVTATASNGKQAVINVTVKTVPVTAITMDKTLALTKKETKTLTYTLTPSDPTDSRVSWESRNTSVATVDQTGKVTAVAPGVAEIVLTALGGNNVTATCTVTVNPILPTSLTLDKSEVADKKIGDKFKLTATLSGPADFDYNSSEYFEWSSTAESVAIVDGNGNVEIKGSGSATIKVTHKHNKSISAQCSIDVAVEAQSLTITYSGQLVDGFLQVYKGDVVQFGCEVTPENYEGGLNWGSTNGSFAVDQTGKLTVSESVSDNATATIFVEADNGVSASLNVKALPILVKEIKIDNPIAVFSLDDYDHNVERQYPNPDNEQVNIVEEFDAGDDVVLTASLVSPLNAAYNGVNWSSSNTDIVTIDENGMLIPNKNGRTGNVTITATSKDNPLCKVDMPLRVVGPRPTNHVINSSTGNFKLNGEGASLKLSVTLFDSNCYYEDLSVSYRLGTYETNGSRILLSPDGTVTTTINAVNAAPVSVYYTFTYYVYRNGQRVQMSHKDIVQPYNANVEDQHVDVMLYPETPESIKLTLPGRTLKIGETWDLNPTAYPDKFASTYTEFVEFGMGYDFIDNDDYEFHAIHPGQNNFKLMLTRGTYDILPQEISAEGNIYVEPYWVETIGFKESSMDITVGSEASLKDLLVFTSDTDGVQPSFKNVSWVSNYPGIVEVDGDGNITAKAEGTATITATTSSSWSVPSGQSQKSATFTVKVSPAVSCSIGDYIYSDGSLSSNLEAGKTVIGVVYAVMDATLNDPQLKKDYPSCKHGLAISVSQSKSGIGMTTYYWTDVYNYAQEQGGYADMSAQNKVCGYSNTAAMKAFKAVYSDSSKYLDNLGSHPNGTTSAVSTLYMPSEYELSLIAANYATINSKLSSAGITQLTDFKNSWTVSEMDGLYWSSTYYGFPTNSYLYALSTGTKRTGLSPMSYSMLIRPVFAF